MAHPYYGAHPAVNTPLPPSVTPSFSMPGSLAPSLQEQVNNMHNIFASHDDDASVTSYTTATGRVTTALPSLSGSMTSALGASSGGHGAFPTPRPSGHGAFPTPRPSMGAFPTPLASMGAFPSLPVTNVAFPHVNASLASGHGASPHAAFPRDHGHGGHGAVTTHGAGSPHAMCPFLTDVDMLDPLCPLGCDKSPLLISSGSQQVQGSYFGFSSYALQFEDAPGSSPFRTFGIDLSPQMRLDGSRR